jgi:hypothetical protein
MKQFIIKSPKVEGEVRVMYNEGQLQKIDFSGAKLQVFEIENFKRKVPALQDHLNGSFNEQTTIVETDFEISLEDFKREYPYKRNTHLLPDLWNKMSSADKVLAYYAAIEYRRYCERNDWYNPKIAATWLTKKEYLNDWKTM